MEQEQLNMIIGSLADAIRTAVTQAREQSPHSSTMENIVQASKPPSFAMSEYKNAEGSSVHDYFVRFDWALQLSKIPEGEYHNYARVHMGGELNSALRILISPRQPEDLTYNEIKLILSEHFDGKRNIFAESFKFRQVKQECGESLAAFVLRLKQAATFCEYGTSLDRMLIEQMIFGLESRSICDDIIARKPGNFSEAYEIAYSRELTQRSTNAVNTADSNTTEPTCKLGYTPVKTKNENRARTSTTTTTKCYGCGGQHLRRDCKFRNAKCFSCGKLGHIGKVCNASLKQVSEPVVDDDDEMVQFINQVGTVRTTGAVAKKIITVSLNGKNVDMELDTGAPCSVMCIKNFKALNEGLVLGKSDRQFSSCTGQRLDCIGKAIVNVTFGKTCRKLNLYIVNDNVDTLCGRDWIVHFAHDINFIGLFDTNTRNDCNKLDLCSSTEKNTNTISIQTSILTTEQQHRLQQLLIRYDVVFDKTAGTFKGPAVKVHLKPDARPIFARPREIPFALRDAYAKEIEARISAGFYKKVEFSEWASTTHIVSKKNGGIRITGNYKPTINPQMVIDEHPIPKTEDIFNKMKGATVFAHLDVTDAYSHLVVDEEFAHVLTLNTPTHGLIRPTRAVYGSANIPAIWQRTMETVLQDIPNILNFFDDILIYAKNLDELFRTLEITLERLRSLGFKLNRPKCVFAASSIEFLGHRIDAQGIHKSSKHVDAILQSSKPSTIDDLQLFLGKASYYSNFMPELSTLERPLRDIIKSGKFSWSKGADEAYEKIRNILVSPQVLMPYDPDLPLILATDASKTGLGAVLSHRLQDNQERPIAYASRTMTTTEQKYSQIDKEALAIVWAVQKFFKYLYARHWTLITDHKPLVQILQPGKSLPVLCISRMANYADFLSNFDFNVVHKNSKENANADYLSRIKVCSANSGRVNEVGSIMTDCEYDEFDNFIIRQINQLPLTAVRIAQETKKDDHLGKILKLLESGKCLAGYGYKSPEVNYKLSAGCLTFEHRIVIPPKFRPKILEQLHGSHLGVIKMKGIGRSFVYWPGVDKDIENTAKECDQCAENAKNPPKFKDHHWEYPKSPWERVHIDYAGPIDGMMILIITDAYSKWLDVKVTKSITSAATIMLLDEVFATYGVPLMVVSDNGTNFSSVEFNTFLTNVGVKYHKYTAPYHPSTNGQAERYVQTVKNALKAMRTTKETLRENLNEFLRQYRNAPHYTTGQSPAQLFLGRQLRTRLDLLRPEDVNIRVPSEQYLKSNHEYRQFEEGDVVDFHSGNPRLCKWIKGKVNKRLGDIHYEILFQGKYYKRHVDQIRSRGNKGALELETSNILPKENSDYNITNNANGGYLHDQTHQHSNREDDIPMSGSNTCEQQSEDFATPSGASGFKGFTSTPSTNHREVSDRSASTPNIKVPQQECDLRRSGRVRRPRVLFSP